MAQLFLTKPPRRIVLDYDTAEGVDDIVHNLSGVAVAGDHLWTVSDEGRTMECLESRGNGFKLSMQFHLDQAFAKLPPGKECDLEAVAVEGGRLWLCGSHCEVRRRPERPATLNPRIRSRLSRNILGSIKLDRAGGQISGIGTALRTDGKGSLRYWLRDDPYLKPFLKIPSKENGLDIEGLAVTARRVLIGLRGPVLDSYAVVLEMARRGAEFDLRRKPRRHFLDLGGLGVRDIVPSKYGTLVLAGPVTGALGNFRIYRWLPGVPDRVQEPQVIYSFAVGAEHPEGICVLVRDAKPGLLVVYDSPDKSRISGARYKADWFAFAGVEH